MRQNKLWGEGKTMLKKWFEITLWKRIMGALVLERSTVLAAQRRADGLHNALDGLAA